MGVGLLVAACFGSSSILARLAVGHLGSLATTWLAQAAGLLVLCLGLLFAAPTLMPRGTPWWASILPGLLLGVVGAAGSLALYQAFTCGPVMLVSPIAAAQGLVAVVLAIVFLHERPSVAATLALGGIVLGVVGTTTKLRELPHLRHAATLTRNRIWIAWAMLAMCCFGLQLFLLGVWSPGFGWFFPVLVARGTSVVLLGLLLLWLRQSRAPATPLWAARGMGGWLAASAGLCNVAGLLLYSLEVQWTPPGVAAALQSCYVLLPMAFGAVALRERPAVSQVVSAGGVIVGLLFLELVTP